MPKKKLTCSNDSSMHSSKNKYVACMQENLNKNEQTNKQTNKTVLWQKVSSAIRKSRYSRRK